MRSKLCFAPVLTGLMIVLVSCTAQAPAESDAASGSSDERIFAEPIAIELFTSQGCSSCPPADELIAEYADNPAYVVITRPVTYWDRLGWHDTLGREENTALQRAYASRLSYGGGRAYTPQAVVGGEFGLVGSRRSELEEAIEDARERRTDVSIEVNKLGADWHIRAQNLRSSATAYLIELDASVTIAIGAGENRGRTVTYSNVVTAERTLGELTRDGSDIRITSLELSASGADRHAIILREGAAGPIIAARYL